MPSAILDQLDTFGPDSCQPVTYDQAVEHTRALARSQYENFSVVSWLLPKRLRDDFRNVYAFCRWADDLGDETGDPEKSRQLLAWWRDEVDRCYADQPRHYVFVALADTIKKHDIPRKPFDDLIDAFVQDQDITRYDSWEQVLDYCTRSADPVGRLVLYMCGYRDEERQILSDSTCTALQLANFWQDVRRDILERDRVYIPADVASNHGLDIETMVREIKRHAAADPICNSCSATHQLSAPGINALLPSFRKTIRELVDRTWPMFERGRALLPMVAPDVRVDVALFSRGGESILRMIERQNCNTLEKRPKLSRGAKINLMMRAVAGKLFGGVS